MKAIHFYCFSLLGACFVVCGPFACVLDKEPDIATGATNEQDPVFLSTQLIPISHDSIRAKARLSSRGNLNVLHYGWVWRESAGPTVQDNKMELGELGIDSFVTVIPGFTLGKIYYLRPYVMTGSGETYGPEQAISMDIPKVEDLLLLADSACFLHLQGKLQSPLVVSEYGIVYLARAGTPTLQKKDGQIPGYDLNNGVFLTDLTMLSPQTEYTLRAYVTTTSGTGYSRTLIVTTPGSNLSADFSFNTDLEIFQGAIVQFTNTSTDASAYLWTFGDGGNSNMVSPTHTFSFLDSVKVQLTVANQGCSVTKDTVFHVISDPFQNYWMPIPGGSFVMGCTPEQAGFCGDNENPAHEVTLDGFFMGKTEITQRLYVAVTGNNPSSAYQCGLDCPVEFIEWPRVVNEFIPALNRKTGRMHRLPTEAEWEYAARGGSDASSMTLYAGSNVLDPVAWYQGNSDSRVHPVAQKEANGFGLYDMSGNVEEMCSDFYDAGYYSVSPSINPSGPAMGNYYVVRGGAWLSTTKCRVSSRDQFPPGARTNSTGFRIARN